MSVVHLILLASVAAPFLLSIWVAFVHRPALVTRESAAEGTGTFEPARTGFAAESLDLEPEARAAAQALHGRALACSVQVELAIPSELKVRVDPNVLRTALRATVSAAIEATPGGQVLITGRNLGADLHIRITDDGKITDQRTRESLVREAQELIALQGGSLSVEVSPGRATTMIVRLPLPPERPADLTHVPALVEQAA